MPVSQGSQEASPSAEAPRRLDALCIVADDEWPIVQAAARGLADVDRIEKAGFLWGEPCDIWVISHRAMGAAGWNDLVPEFSAVILTGWRFVLIGIPDGAKQMPRRNVVAKLAKAEEKAVRASLLHAVGHARESAQGVWRKAEPRINRLLYMARQLDLGGVRLRDVADHFEVSMRTVQRDLDVLLCSDWPIQACDEPGSYRLPGGLYCDCFGCMYQHYSGRRPAPEC